MPRGLGRCLAMPYRVVSQEALLYFCAFAPYQKCAMMRQCRKSEDTYVIGDVPASLNSRTFCPFDRVFPFSPTRLIYTLFNSRVYTGYENNSLSGTITQGDVKRENGCLVSSLKRHARDVILHKAMCEEAEGWLEKLPFCHIHWGPIQSTSMEMFPTYDIPLAKINPSLSPQRPVEQSDRFWLIECISLAWWYLGDFRPPFFFLHYCWLAWNQCIYNVLYPYIDVCSSGLVLTMKRQHNPFSEMKFVAHSGYQMFRHPTVFCVLSEMMRGCPSHISL